MKKLLAGGEEKIFTFAPAFRNRERGALHAPEFTMLEWYRARAPYETLWEDCAQILQIAAAQTGRAQWTWRDRTSDVMKPYDSLSVYDAFAQYAGIPLDHAVHAAGGDRGALAAIAEQRGYRISSDDSWSDTFSQTPGSPAPIPGSRVRTIRPVSLDSSSLINNLIRRILVGCRQCQIVGQVGQHPGNPEQGTPQRVDLPGGLRKKLEELPDD